MSDLPERPPAAHNPSDPQLTGPMANWLAPTAESRVERIPSNRIVDRPWWPGDDTDATTLAALRASIAARGIIEPLLLRRRGPDGFEVVCGARRLRVARDLGQTHVPAIVRDLSEREALLVAAWTTVERRQRTGDRATVRERLMAAGLTADETTALADRPVAATARPAPEPPAFILSPVPLSRPRRLAADVPFLRPRTGVLPIASPEELAAALVALDGVSPVALVR